MWVIFFTVHKFFSLFNNIVVTAFFLPLKKKLREQIQHPAYDSNCSNQGSALYKQWLCTKEITLP